MKNKILLFLSLVILGLLGNIYNIKMFFGVNQIFGSIFVLIAVWFFGPYLGLLCAILVHSYTIYLWGHPYAFIGFILEAFVVGVLLRWRISNLQADYVRLKQVLLNLLSNAINYHGSEQPQIWLSYSNKGDDLEISVRDNGPGIAKDKQHNIFESFNRVGSENSYIEGSGIGLFISMKLLDMMQANIAMESELGAGCHFKLTLALREKSDAS